MIEADGQQQILPAGSDISRFNDPILEFLLDTQIPLLNERCFEVTVYRAKFKRLCSTPILQSRRVVLKNVWTRSVENESSSAERGNSC